MALWTNLLKQAANIDDSASPWSGNGSFTITAAASMIPGQTAHRHEYVSGSTQRAQTAGTFPAPATEHTIAALLENVSADSSSCRIWDGSVGIVAGVRYDWTTGAVTGTGSTFGSDVTLGVVELPDLGPNGGPVVLLWTTATPDNTGTSREVFVYPGGAATTNAGDTAILHYAGLHPADTFSPAYLVTGSTTPEHRVIDLSDHKVRVRPGQQYRDLDHKRRRASGKMSTTKHSDATRARVWRLETVIEDRATGEALQAELDAPGRIQVVHNPIIHHVTGVAAECEARSVRRLDGPLEDHVRLSFELVETRPV